MKTRAPCSRRALKGVASFVAMAGAACADGTPLERADTELQVRPARLDFGEVPVGEPRTIELELTNDGPRALPLCFGPIDDECRETSEASHEAYRVHAPNGQRVLAPHATIVVQVEFRPSAPGAQAAELRLRVAGERDLERRVPMNGTGVEPMLELTPTAIDLGSVRIGTESAASIDIHNPTTWDLVVRWSMESSVFAAPHPPERPLPSGARLTLPLRFRPDVRGDHTADLEFASCATCRQTVVLSGRGTAPSFHLTPPNIDFGALEFGTRARSSFRIVNTSEDPVQVTDLLPGANASLPGLRRLPVWIEGGQSFDFELELHVARIGEMRVRVAIFTDAWDDPSTPERESEAELSARVTGLGSDLVAEPTSLEFGDVGSGVRLATHEVVLRNVGNRALTVRDAWVEGAQTFSGSALRVPLSLAPGQSVTATVGFAPTALGPQAGAWVVVSDESIEPRLEVPLTGTGVVPRPCTVQTQPDLHFGIVRLGRSGAENARLVNAGDFACSINAVELTAGPELAIVSGAPGIRFAIAPGDHHDVRLSFTPSVAGLTTGTLAVTSDDPQRPVASIALSGLAPPPPASAPIYVHTREVLFSYDPGAGEYTRIGTFLVGGRGVADMVDVAIDADGTMYAGSQVGDLFLVNPATAECTLLRILSDTPTGVTVLPDGRLVVAGNGVRAIDPNPSHPEVVEQLVARGLYRTSGDIIALPDGYLYMSVVSPTTDVLVRINPATHQTTEVGQLPVHDLYGLAYHAGIMYGFDGLGGMFMIDPLTAAPLAMGHTAMELWGATANPVHW